MKLTTLTLRQQNQDWSWHPLNLQFFPLLAHLLEAWKRINVQIPLPQIPHTHSHHVNTYLCHVATVSCGVDCFTLCRVEDRWSSLLHVLRRKVPQHFTIICFGKGSIYSGADKSLARPDRKNNWKFAIFRPTRWSLLPRRSGWTDNFLIYFWLACKS